jgi:phosphoglycerate kinase
MLSAFRNLSGRAAVVSRNFHASVAAQSKKTIDQLAKASPGIFKNANVLVRVDFNVPFDKKDPTAITDDTRIREALPTIQFLVDHGAKVMLTSHAGRPKGKVNEAMRMKPMALRLGELMGREVRAVPDCIGPDVAAAVAQMKGGEVVMLENTRFRSEEEKNDADFSKELAKHASIFVNDAFGTAHRAHASTAGVASFVQHKVAGFLLEKEIRFLKSAVDAPVRPFAAIVGGAKVSTKIPVIESLLEKCDKILIGGGMMFTFYRAMGLNVGASMVEEEFVEEAKKLITAAKAKGVSLILPTDVMIAKEFSADSEARVVSMDDMPAAWLGLDIGPESIKTFTKEISECKTVVWNGPMGVFEFAKFSDGTFAIAKALADITSKGSITIIGGGDSVAAVNTCKLNDQMSHISTGGGASLEMLEGKELPGVAVLDDA